MAKKSELAIQVKNLSKRYKKSKELAVDNINFDVKQGSFFAFLGPNGAGKTTTLRILTTLLNKTSGEAFVNGHDVIKEDTKVRQEIGVIFQNPSLDLNLTAEENIRFHANLYNLYGYRPFTSMMNKNYQKRLKKLANVLGIEKDLGKPVKTFSGGMKRKLEIIRSLMHNPKILFLDEPTTGLDPGSRRRLWKYIKEVQKDQGITVFLTTHYLEEAEDADHVAVINHGKIVAEGTPRELKNRLIEKYIVLGAKDNEKLEKELKKHRFKYEGKGPFRITLNGKSAQDIISKIKTKLEILDIHNPTLEDAYLEIIGEEEEN